jgi:hypothetical protein
LAPSTDATRAAGPLAHPTFQPVKENVLPPLEIVSVRSHMPGSVAIGTCGTSKVRCSYTSSLMTTRSCSRATCATAASSSAVSTVPVGLCGVFSRIAVVRGVTAARSSSSGSRKSGARSVTGRRTAPAIWSTAT